MPLRAHTLFLYLVLLFVGSAPAQDDPFKPGAIVAEGVPVVPAELIERLRQYQAVRSAEFRGWAPDGSGIVVRTQFGATSQLHRVFEPGGRREQVTFFVEPADGRFQRGERGGSTLLVDIAAGGNEQYQIHWHDLSSGRTRLLTDGTSRNLRGPVAEDGSFVVYSSSARNGRDMDILVRPLGADGAGESRTVMPVDNEFWVPTDLSRDGRRLLLIKYVSINESYPAVLDLETGRRTPIPFPAVAEGPVSVQALRFAPGDATALLAIDARGEFLELAAVDLASGAYRWLAEGIAWDVESIEVDERTGRVAFAVNEDGAGALYLLDDVAGGAKPQRVELPLGIVADLEFSPDGERLGLTLARPDAPADAYSLRLSDKSLTQWTFSESGGLDTSAFVAPRRVQFPSFDDRRIPAYVFAPRGATAERPAPVLINIHGGPESQYRPTLAATDQFYVNELGIAVVRPNVRGSAGYGKTYLRLDNAELREDSVRDIGALLDWIAAEPTLDANRVAVYGGSYGGYMVLSSLMHYSDRLRAGVDIVGIASFQTFLKNTSEYRRDLRRAEYGDERLPRMQELFERIDPLRHADRIRTALLVAHGRNDPRVPFSEAEQIAPRVRDNGQEVWTVYADNEGHGFGRRENRDYLTAAVTLFLQRHLRPDADAGK